MPIPLQAVQRAFCILLCLDDVGIDHGGIDVLVSQERLNRPQVGPRLQKVCGEAMPKRMDAGVFDDSCFGQRVPERPLRC